MQRVFSLLVLAAAVGLAGCGTFGLGGRDEPPGIDRETARERTVDPVVTVALVNAHRAARGRPPLTVDPALTAIAAETAIELARRDRLMTEMHSAGGLERRLAGRFRAERAAENIGAGYPTLATTVEGWKASRPHNDNLLNREMTHLGIGLAVTEQGKFHSYWVLLLARPDDPNS